MNLKEKISGDLKSSLRARDGVRVSTLRMLLASVHNREIDERKKDVGLANEEVEAVIRQEVKKRADALSEYQKAGRGDLAREEKEELGILQSYLPPELDDASVKRVVEESIHSVDAAGPQDFGKVMKSAMAALRGKASGDRVSAAVKKLLAPANE